MSKILHKTGILLVAFGSATPTGQQTLALFDAKVRALFPHIPIRWAFTSERMRDRLTAARKKTDSVKKALCRMIFEKYSHIAVQSLHLIPGMEYEALYADIINAQRESGFAHIEVGMPLMASSLDVTPTARALLAHIPKERQPEDAVICMAHGTKHDAATGYDALAAEVLAVDPRIFIGTLEGSRSINHILPLLQGKDIRRAWLLPLLAVIGKHAETDMAGETPRSWRSQIEAYNIQCIPVLKGTAEYTGFINIWLTHLADAIKKVEEKK